ncbi:MAG TPA: histidine phosphatase family protein [Jiangellaceae bacterium]|nr:histidine phosphatase family protein [Jiangellaceae bacterium]
MSRRVVLWRHGRTEWNATGRFQGQSDIDLDDLGREQAGAAARHLAALKPEVVVSSDLVRARDTAAALHAIIGGTAQADPRLRETFAGRWQGLTVEQIQQHFADEYEAWRAGDPTLEVGGGECRRDVAQRMVAACTQVSEALPDDGLAVLVTHGGSARLAIASLIGLPLERFTNVGGLSNGSWSMLRASGPGTEHGWILMEHNAGTLPPPVTIEEG